VKEKIMVKGNGTFFIIFCLSILLLTCSKSTNSDKTNSNAEPTYRSGFVEFKNQSNLEHVVLFNYRHIRGGRAESKTLRQWVPKGSSYTLRNLMDGSDKPFQGGDIVDVNFYCDWPGGAHKSHSVEVLIDGNKTIIVVEDCRYLMG